MVIADVASAIGYYNQPTSPDTYHKKPIYGVRDHELRAGRYGQLSVMVKQAQILYLGDLMWINVDPEQIHLVKWIIQDWTGRNIFPGMTFATFDEGWGHVREHSPEEDHEDIYVVKEDEAGKPMRMPR